ncbi:MAG: NAD-dependent epimerase/dehydratase family protein [Gemmatimonadaceae bacterium]
MSTSRQRARVAVTGATGQVGAAVVRRLHDEGWTVVAAARNQLGGALIHAAAPDCDIRVGSLTRANGKHLLDDCEVIVNCALASSGGNPRQAYVRNRALIDGLLDARSLQWLVHFSTVAVFGELIREQRDEQRAFEHPRPGSEYGRSKLYVERYTVRQARARDINCTVLRLGHVYGAGISRSREIIDFARAAGFRLPFDGRLPSNAIHVDRMSHSIAALLARAGDGRATSAMYSFAERESTWRAVFDWHTGALGLRAVAGLSDLESDAARDVWSRSSIPGEIGGWIRGLPVKRLLRSPAMFDMALRVLVRTPAGLTSRVTDLNRRVGARGHVARAIGGEAADIPPLYVSAGMPGPFLDLTPIPSDGPGSDAARSSELRDWFQMWSVPRLGASGGAGGGGEVGVGVGGGGGAGGASGNGIAHAAGGPPR